jgi:hypothetical protein
MLIINLLELLGLISSFLALRLALAVYSPRPFVLITLIRITFKLIRIRILRGLLFIYFKILKRKKKL